MLLFQDAEPFVYDPSLKPRDENCQSKSIRIVMFHTTFTWEHVQNCLSSTSFLFSQPQWYSHVWWRPPHLLTSVGLKLLPVCMMFRGAANYWMRLLVSDCIQWGVQCVMSSVTWGSCDHTGLAYRLCSSSGQWEKPDVRGCQSVTLRDLEKKVDSHM